MPVLVRFTFGCPHGSSLLIGQDYRLSTDVYNVDTPRYAYSYGQSAAASALEAGKHEDAIRASAPPDAATSDIRDVAREDDR